MHHEETWITVDHPGPDRRRIPSSVWLMSLTAVLVMVLYAYRSFFDVTLFSGDAFIKQWGGDTWGYLELADGLLKGKGYYLTGHASAAREPATALWYAGWMAAFGVNYAAILLANGAILMGSVVMAYLLGEQVLGRSAGLVAAAMTAGNLNLVITSIYALSEPPFFLFTTAMFLMLASFWRDGRSGQVLWAGLWFAAAVMTRGTMATFLPVLLWAAWKRRRLAVQVFLMALPTVVAVGVWTARNYATFHQFIPSTTRYGMAFLSDNSVEGLKVSFWAPYSQIYIAEAEMRALALDTMPPPDSDAWELEVDRRSKQMIRETLAAHPWLYASRSLRRLIALFSPYLEWTTPPWLRGAQALKFVLVIVPGLIGMWRWRREPWGLAALLFVVSTSVLLSLVSGDKTQRYRLAFEPVLTVLAAGVLVRWWQALQARRAPSVIGS